MSLFFKNIPVHNPAKITVLDSDRSERNSLSERKISFVLRDYLKGIIVLDNDLNATDLENRGAISLKRHSILRRNVRTSPLGRLDAIDEKIE